MEESPQSQQVIWPFPPDPLGRPRGTDCVLSPVGHTEVLGKSSVMSK